MDKESTSVREHIGLEPPEMYNVIILNDDFTTMEFVVKVLMQVFFKSEQEAVTIMLNVHEQGQGIAGTYTYDIAQSKVIRAVVLARDEDFPLRFKIQKQ